MPHRLLLMTVCLYSRPLRKLRATNPLSRELPARRGLLRMGWFEQKYAESQLVWLRGKEVSSVVPSTKLRLHGPDD
ncbi:UNVERIFIED_CONTAM: hypothetical protein K2H54_042868 [Gekko kuhli]